MLLTFSTIELPYSVVTVKFINKIMSKYSQKTKFSAIKFLKYKKRMNTKNLMVSFVAIVMALFLVATVSASPLADVTYVTVNGIAVYNGTSPIADVSVVAGETITVKVYFTADEDDTDVTVKAEIEGDKVDFEDETQPFDVEKDSMYRKVLNLKVPYELKDAKNGTVTLNIEFDGKNYDVEVNDILLKVQRPSYNVDFKSINVAQNVEVGETFPIDVVLKNTGYNDLEDLYVTARISALDVEKTSYFGDLVAIEDPNDDDDTDTLSRRFYLTVPYDVLTGAYTLEVEVSNEDTVLSKTVVVEITNSFPELVIKSGDSLILVNPTDKVVGYKIFPESPASVSESIVFVQAGSSETVVVTTNAQGEYSLDVSVFSMDGKLVSTVTFTGSEEVASLASPIVILTVVLAIIFLVLLVVLIVLVTKKPEKAEEFGESYY